MPRRFGCELEFSSVKTEVIEILENKLKSRLRRLEPVTYKKWQVKNDNSTSGEVVTPICTKNSIGQIMMICNLLKAKGIEITDNDGFHVHVSIKQKEIDNILALWVACEADIFKAFPKCRRSNTYCKKLTRKSNLPPILSLSSCVERSGDHHSVVSTYRDDINTIEFRIAEGTLDAQFVRAWINFCLSFVEFASKMNPLCLLEKPYYLTLSKVASMIKLNRRDTTILMNRRRKYGKLK